MTLGKLHNLPEQEKLDRIKSSADHLQLVSRERQHYKDCISRCREALPARLAHSTPLCRRSLSYRGEMHYSLDYAQQIHLPYDSQQVGPLYFLTGYKVGLFGISIEPINHFVLYVIPEACSVGKGSNSVISFLHHCLENFSFGATNLLLHADNCVGQNKNRYILHYCEWLVMMGIFETVEMAYLIVGHTKFDVDTRLGIFKWKWIHSSAHTLKDVCEIAGKTANTSIVLVGDEQGNAAIPQYDWATFFDKPGASTIKNIRKYHHFRTAVENPGIITHRTTCDAPDESSILLADTFNWGKDAFPSITPPPGLSVARQTYLNEKIRPYVRKSAQNILCPKPSRK
jgi:hypothetical protein